MPGIGTHIRVGRRRGGGSPDETFWTSLLSATVEETDKTKVILTFSNSDTALVASDFAVRNKEAFINNLPDYAIGLYNLNQGQYYNGKTYLAYMGADDDPYILTYTHATSTFSASVKIGTNPLLNTDGHGEPCILIDATGYIHCMWGGHNSAIQYSKSTNPEDISAWTTKTSPASGTYPQLMQMSNGTIYMFYRDASTPKKWGSKYTANGGTNWAAFVEITNDLSYGFFKKGVGYTVHGIMLGYPQTTNYNRYNIYYLKFDGTDWKNIKGDTLTLPVDHLDDFLVYNSGTSYTPSTAFAFDSSNNPYILFTEGATETGAFAYKFAKWVTDAWVITDLGVSSSHWRDFASSLDCISSSVFETYLVTGGPAETIGGNIEKWVSADAGATWAKELTIIADTRQYIDPILIKDYHADAKLFFAQYRGITHEWVGQGFFYGANGFLNKIKSVSSLSRDATNKILTLTLSEALVSSENLQVILKALTPVAVTNNIEAEYNPLPYLLNYFPMTEASGNMIDVVSANNGVLTGATQNVTGILGKCYSFDGGDKVVLSSAHTFLITQSFTFAFWVKCNALNVTGYMMDKIITTESPRVAFVQVNTDLLFAIRQVVPSIIQDTLTWPGILTTNWILVGGVRDVSTGKMYLYANAVAYGTPLTYTITGTVTFTVKLGMNLSDLQGFTGLMGPFMLWVGRILTQGEWNYLYKSGLGRAYPF